MASAPDLISEEEIIIDLHGRLRGRGDVKRLAYEIGVAQGTLSNLLTGGKAVGRGVAEKLGYRRVVMFARIETRMIEEGEDR